MDNLKFDLLKATEQAAIAAFEYAGSGDIFKIDESSTNAMRNQLNKMDFRAKIVVGEGEKDSMPHLKKGELVGHATRSGYSYYDWSLATDPTDGSKLLSKNLHESMSVLAIGKRDCLLPIDAHYMSKIAVGQQIASKVQVSLKKSLGENVELMKHALGRSPIICVLERPRHERLIQNLRNLGVKLKLITDCDVSAAICSAMPDNEVDAYISVGGCAEGVTSACAIKALGGYFEGMIVDFKTYYPFEKVTAEDKVYTMEELAKDRVMFFASGILNGNLLKGIEKKNNSITVHSIVMDSEIKGFQRISSTFCY